MTRPIHKHIGSRLNQEIERTRPRHGSVAGRIAEPWQHGFIHHDHIAVTIQRTGWKSRGIVDLGYAVADHHGRIAGIGPQNAIGIH